MIEIVAQELYNGYGSCSEGTSNTSSYNFENELKNFPVSYRPLLEQLHKVHPAWIFYADYINADFEEFVDAEVQSGHVCTSQAKYTEYRNGKKWRDPKYAYTEKGVWYSGYDDGYYAATREAVKYFMNPVNMLNDIEVFQFLSAKYDANTQNPNAVEDVLGDSKLSGKADVFLKAGGTNTSAVFLAAKAMIESGGGTSRLATGTVDGYKGYYNMYGIGASDGNARIAGAKMAKKNGWDTQDKAIIGGGKWIYNHYVKVGQDTLYSMKWNVHEFENSGTVSHQYATNISDAYSKAYRFADGLQGVNAPLTFRIPVFR